MNPKENVSGRFRMLMKHGVPQLSSPIFGYILWVMLFGIAAYTSCSKEEQTQPGLTVSNLCFTIQGGDVSNNLRANQSWAIVFEDTEDSWVTVSPSAGSANSNLIPLVFTAQVNNNTNSRNQLMTLSIGDRTYSYIIYQDGTLQQTCNN